MPTNRVRAHVALHNDILCMSGGILLHGFLANVNGPGGWAEKFKVDAAGNLYTYGNAYKPGGSSWLNFLDERLKTITGQFTSGLDAIMKLQPLGYEYKPDNALNLPADGVHIGFSAQAVMQTIPQAVTRNDMGYLLVNNDPIVWTMLSAVKEQQARIADQRKRIAEQEEEVRQQQEQIPKLEERLTALDALPSAKPPAEAAEQIRWPPSR